MRMPWQRRRDDRQLSEYLDGELGPGETAAVGERLVFDRRSRDRLAAFERLSELVDAALSPPRQPDAALVADRLEARVARQPRARVAPAAAGRAWVRPAAVLASVGLLLTAGLTVAQLRRRGVI